MHIYQIDTSTEVIGLKIQLGSFGVTGGQKVIFTLKAITRQCYVA